MKMSFFGSKLFGGITGSFNDESSRSESSISGAETIETLCERLQSSVLVEDRHEALKAIKSLTKKYKLEVGTQAMPILIEVIIQNRMDTDLCCLALETLHSVMSNHQKNQDSESTQNLPIDISTQFTEMFIKENSNLILLFDLLDEFEFKIRWASIKLLNQLVINQTEKLQEKILQIPRGVSRLIDLLNDSREIIRNDAILILSNLAKTNANIQKIIAFESGFDRIMEIIQSEGNILDGGVVVEDCFNLLINLLQMNYTNQKFFKEANYIKKICQFFDVNNSNNINVKSKMLNENVNDFNNVNNWTLQKTTNLSLLLKLIRCLVAPNNQQQIINDCQKAYNHFGLLHRLCALITSTNVPADLLSQAISTVGEVIRGNYTNQQLFSTVMMQTNPPRPILIILLLSMINDRQPFHLRCSILYCFQCFLYKNEEKKAEIINTLLPKENLKQEHIQITVGQILCTGLFAPNDFISNWLCAVAFAHTINNSNLLKEQLLRVQLTLSNSTSVKPVSLLQQCMNILIEIASSSQGLTTLGSNNSSLSLCYQFQTIIAILMLISTWLSNCASAVNSFVSYEQNIPYLISQASASDTEDKSLIIQGVSSFCLGLILLYNSNQVEAFNVDNLRDTIKKRIGIEQFEHKLEFISQHESYTKTLKQPKFAFDTIKSNDLLFDYEFTRLFKSNETLIIAALNNKNLNLPNFLMQESFNKEFLSNGLETKAIADVNSKSMLKNIDEQDTLIISQYQQLIREQDNKLKELENKNQILAQTCSQLEQKSREIQSDNQTLNDKHLYQSRINELEIKCKLLEEKCSEQEDDLCKIQREKGVLQETINNLKNSDKNTEFLEIKAQNFELKIKYQDLNQEQENLLTLLQEMELKIKSYKKILKKYNENISEDESEEGQDYFNNFANANEIGIKNDIVISKEFNNNFESKNNQNEKTNIENQTILTSFENNLNNFYSSEDNIKFSKKEFSNKKELNYFDYFNNSDQKKEFIKNVNLENIETLKKF